MSEDESGECLGGFVVPPEFANRLFELQSDPEKLAAFNARMAEMWREKIAIIAAWMAGQAEKEQGL